MAAHPIIRITAYASDYQTYPCSRQCRCACHRIKGFRSPNVIHRVLGDLFLGYSGCPIRVLQRCTETKCLSQSVFRAHAYYAFPSWFLCKALDLHFAGVYPDTINMSLTVRRVVGHGAEIFRMVDADDSAGLRRLFEMGWASPNDSHPSGETALWVCNISELGRTIGFRFLSRMRQNELKNGIQFSCSRHL